LHNLIVDKIKFKSKINDHFEDLQKRQSYLNEQNETNNSIFGEVNNEKSIEKKNNDLDKKLISLYQFHSNKFHKPKFIKLKDDLLNMRLNLSKKSELENLNSKNSISVSKLRQKIAFRFRFMNNIPSKNNNKPINQKKFINYKKQNDRMNRILKMSKSIPDILYKEIGTVRENEENIKNNFIENSLNSIGHGLYNSFKSKRYTGNIYNYYKSDRPLYFGSNTLIAEKTSKNNEYFNKLINKEGKNKNAISIIDENPGEKNIKSSNSNKSRINKNNNTKINKDYIKKTLLKKDGYFKLNDLLP
jgi:hypothetical protein